MSSPTPLSKISDKQKSKTKFPTVYDLSSKLFKIILDDFDRTFREYLHGSDVTKTDKYVRIQSGLPHPIANLLIARERKNAELLSKAVEPYCTDEFPSAVAILGSVSEEVDEMLKRCDFQLTMAPAMALDLMAMNLSKPDVDCTIQQVGADEHELWVDTMAVGYELPRPFADRFGPGMVATIAKGDEEYRYFIINHRNRAVATAVLIIRNGIIGVYNISTIPDLRGRGVGRFATGEPLRLAREEGYRTAILQSSDLGEPVYRRLGFKSYGEIPFYARIPGS